MNGSLLTAVSPGYIYPAIYWSLFHGVLVCLQVMLRVHHLRSFGDFLCSVDSIPLNYDTDKNLFFGPLLTQAPEGNEQAAQQQLVSVARRLLL